ncbi:uncharacterized protein KD926_009502 [Aspergillus affinis]|uniref:uncharacterized protein n=1 Tax=Aspergillus affinis TaxID=1070780 RepID=UPI0022FDD572|nr:uncharacterized protein KD926_009502 [Aspergillus affinis]KAI9039359.1 hypothetical protein KD926_009502 [Aspergillus affinis]
MKYISLILSLTGLSMAKLPKVFGNITVSSQLDIDTQGATDCTVINGDLEITSDFPGYLDLNVIAVTGNVIGRNLNSVSAFSIPAMTAVGGNLELMGSFYTYFLPYFQIMLSPSFPSLQSVNGDFKVLSTNPIWCPNFDDLVAGVRGTFECREAKDVSPAEVGIRVALVLMELTSWLLSCCIIVAER